MTVAKVDTVRLVLEQLRWKPGDAALDSMGTLEEVLQ